MTKPCNNIITNVAYRVVTDVAYRWVPADAVASDICDQVENQVFWAISEVVDHHMTEYLRQQLIYGDCFD